MDYTTLRNEPSDTLFDLPDPPSDNPIEEPFDSPDAEFLKTGKRKPYSAMYERKVKSSLNTIMRLALTNKNTVPDAAAIIMYGTEFSHAMGDWAADDPRVRKAIDFITGGTENPAITAVMALMPLALQVMRNHEPTAEVSHRRIKIPFTKSKYLNVKFKLKLGKRLRNLTNEPQDFTQWVFSNPNIQEALQAQGIKLAAENA